MIKVVVIGSNGLIGSPICSKLRELNSIELHEVNRQNIEKFKSFTCDILINANGSSMKGWCNDNPKESFKVNCLSFYNYMNKFHPKRYILISSVDVYSDTKTTNNTKESSNININMLSLYGFHKYTTECLVEKHYDDHLILRLSAIISEDLRKNALYDITRKKNLIISPFSRLNFIEAKEVAEIISKLLTNTQDKKLNCASSASIELLDIIKLMGLENFYKDKSIEKLPLSNYEISIEKLRRIYKVHSSRFYVSNYIKFFNGVN